ncbi:MAG: hypothetical protein KKI06_03125, partial [Euryarchaeota archaeon]|nr:hypothetical protein [Euryarchaeota archaeon]
MKLTQEYKTQSIYIFIGLIILLFPFFSTYIFLLAFFCGALVLSRPKPDSQVFGILARESDIKQGRLNGLTRLFLTMGTLFLISSIFGPEKFPVFIIAGALAITTFGDGIADLINIHNRQKNSVKVYSPISSIVFLISGGIFAFLAGEWVLWILAGGEQTIHYEFVFFLAVLGSVTGALLESMA